MLKSSYSFCWRLCRSVCEYNQEKHTQNTVQTAFKCFIKMSNKKNRSLKYVYIPYIYISQRDWQEAQFLKHTQAQ